jgi:putative drug exporter of the RND superfamily
VARLIARVGAFSARHKWWTLGAWILVLLVAVAAAGTVSKPMTSTITVSGVSSITTLNTVDKRFSAKGASGAGNVVFAAPAGHRLTAADAATVATLSARLAAVPGVASAPDPFTARTGTLSRDGRIGYIPVSLASGVRTPGSADLTASAATRRGIARAITAARGTGLDVQATSGLVTEPGSSTNPTAGIVIGFIILLITFGSLLTAGLPLVTALLGLVTSLAGISAATVFLPADSFVSIAPTLALLLGLAVGIDYSLFIVHRHRGQLLDGIPVPESIPLAIGTAGSAVVFAALTVVIALAGLSVVGIGFLTQMGLAAAGAVIVAMLMSITLTPALLAVLGTRVLSRRRRRTLGQPRKAPRIAAGWASGIRRRPALYVAAAIVALGILAVPVTTMRLGLPNDGSQPRSTTERRAYDLMADGFGPGANGPIVLLADFPGAAPGKSGIARLAADVRATPDVAQVVPSGVRGNSVLLTVVPRSGPSDAATEHLVHALRQPTLAANLQPAPTVRVTGQTAIAIDISQRLFASLPLYLGLVAGLAFVLLLVVFRSVLIPLKATISFLLSLGAALGCTVAVFQWGWLGGVFGVDPAGPLLCFLPTLTIGVLFGLSMDYEMFLVSGMRERHAHGSTAPDAVAGGFRASGKVVVAAAAIMIGVFGNGVFTGDSTITPIAFSLAIGIVVDAFLVRMTLVPALLFLFGRAAWWLPTWLHRATPHVDVEGTTLPRPTHATT